MHTQGYIDGASGNISARLGENRFLATPSGLAKGFMTPDQLIIVNQDGERIDTPTPTNQHLHPTSELAMHLVCYEQRQDVHGVVHAHPPVAVALTIVGYDFQQVLLPEMLILLGDIPTIPYATPASAELCKVVGQQAIKHDVLLLAYHGSLTMAKTVWDAYLCLESLEHTAKILAMVGQLGGAKNPLSSTQVEQLIAIRRKRRLRVSAKAAPDVESEH